MAYKRKSERPNIIFRRQWKDLFERVCEVEDYEGLGKIVLAMYRVLDGEDISYMEFSPYLQAMFDFILCDVKAEQKSYITTCNINAENKKGKTKKQSLTNETTVNEKNEKNLTSQYKTIQVKSSQDNTSQVNTKKEILSNESIKKEKPKVSRFIPPTRDEVQDYIEEKGYAVNVDRFISYYESNGWKVGKNTMKDWRAAIKTWHYRDSNGGSSITKAIKTTDSAPPLQNSELDFLRKLERREA